ncbi:NAD-P-binding protein [Cristinia sonorae]|uniref:NAD-P-binding protein n=1 Tax=Cristinia sonorae TaxID=1940300 RepID=A0A8K0UE68_9AGAR|nr:NAD-P-binding protein [Cristinia sonorae]
MNHAIAASKQQLLPHKTGFTAENIPDLTGRVVIVTGGSTGIGKATVEPLLRRNAKVYMATRTKSRAEEAIRELRERTGKDAIFLELDLSSLESVQKAAHTFLSQETELHILFNNAGIMPDASMIDQLTADGYDLQYGTHVLGHFFFQELLLPALTTGALSSPDKHSRIVTTSSSLAHMFTVRFDSFKDGPGRRKLSITELYAQSKFLNGVIAHEASFRYAEKGILSFSVDPGAVRTDIFRDKSSIFKSMTNLFFVSPSQGALSQLWSGTMPEAVEHNGQYIVPWAHAGKCRDEMYDRGVGEQVWNILSEQVKDFQTRST